MNPWQSECDARGKTSTTLESLPSAKKVLKENLYIYKIMDPCPVNQGVKRPAKTSFVVVLHSAFGSALTHFGPGRERRRREKKRANEKKT